MRVKTPSPLTDSQRQDLYRAYCNANIKESRRTVDFWIEQLKLVETGDWTP